MTVLQRPSPPSAKPDRLPLAGLTALAAAVCIAILTEALPAGLLPEVSAGLGVSESQAGQLVTVYAIGSVLAAIPLTALTQGLPRRAVLLVALITFAASNAVTAGSSVYALTLAARLVGGAAAGLLWALMAGYAMRMVAPERSGRALAIAMAGAPVALSIGIPAGTELGRLAGWRVSFVTMSVAALVVAVWIVRTVPRFPGEPRSARTPIWRVLRLPGLLPVLIATGAFVTAHNILYTYIAPLLDLDGEQERVGLVLLVFGVVSLAGIALVGAYIDRRLRTLTLASTGLFCAITLTLGVDGGVFGVMLVAFAGWGLAFGGAATLFQTAAARAAGAVADIAQSLVVTAWNVAIALGAVAGGLAVDVFSAAVLPWATLAFAAIALVMVLTARGHGFSPR